MEALSRIGALDIAEAIHERIGTYVDMNFMQFLAVEGDLADGPRSASARWLF